MGWILLGGCNNARIHVYYKSVNEIHRSTCVSKSQEYEIFSKFKFQRNKRGDSLNNSRSMKKCWKWKPLNAPQCRTIVLFAQNFLDIFQGKKWIHDPWLWRLGDRITDSFAHVREKYIHTIAEAVEVWRATASQKWVKAIFFSISKRLLTFFRYPTRQPIWIIVNIPDQHSERFKCFPEPKTWGLFQQFNTF